VKSDDVYQPLGGQELLKFLPNQRERERFRGRGRVCDAGIALVELLTIRSPRSTRDIKRALDLRRRGLSVSAAVGSAREYLEAFENGTVNRQRSKGENLYFLGDRGHSLLHQGFTGANIAMSHLHAGLKRIRLGIRRDDLTPIERERSALVLFELSKNQAQMQAALDYYQLTQPCLAKSAKETARRPSNEELGYEGAAAQIEARRNRLLDEINEDQGNFVAMLKGE
jgi:hypothetical protein